MRRAANFFELVTLICFCQFSQGLGPMTEKLSDCKNLFYPYSEGSEVLVYDWSDGGDMEMIIEDLEGLDLNTLNRRFENSEKLLDWQLWRRELRLLRLRYHTLHVFLAF